MGRTAENGVTSFAIGLSAHLMPVHRAADTLQRAAPLSPIGERFGACRKMEKESAENCATSHRNRRAAAQVTRLKDTKAPHARMAFVAFAALTRRAGASGIDQYQARRDKLGKPGIMIFCSGAMAGFGRLRTLMG